MKFMPVKSVSMLPIKLQTLTDAKLLTRDHKECHRLTVWFSLSIAGTNSSYFLLVSANRFILFIFVAWSCVEQTRIAEIIIVARWHLPTRIEIRHRSFKQDWKTCLKHLILDCLLYTSPSPRD